MDMLHTLMPHTDQPVLFPTNTSAPQLPLMESINCTSVKPKLMLNQKLTMADMDTDTQDTDTDTDMPVTDTELVTTATHTADTDTQDTDTDTDMPVTDTELDTTATHTADTDTIINLLLNKPSTLNHKRLFLKKSFEFV